MDHDSLEYTKFPAAQPQGRRTKTAMAGAAAAGVVVASFFAAGTILFPKADPAAPATVKPLSPPLKDLAPAPVPFAAKGARSLETRSESPLPVPFVSVAAPEVPAAPAGAPRDLDQGGHASPAWTRAATAQRWVWPKTPGARLRTTSLFSRSRAAKSASEDNPAVHRRLAGWFPEAPAGRRVQYTAIGADGGEALVYEADPGAAPANGAFAPFLGNPQNIEDVRAWELARLQQTRGSVRARDVRKDPNIPMAELTYADGRTEVVAYDPLVLDLKGSGVKTGARRVLFDLYGYGKADKLQWMNDLDEGAGILVFDANGSGRSGKNGSEVFGDRTDLSGVGRPDGFANGFEALRALVEKAVAERVLSQGVVDRGVIEEGDLSALEKAYGLRVRVGGFNRKTVSLAAAGVKAIALSGAKTQRIADFDGRSNDLVVQPGAVFLRRDGTTGTYMNVWLKSNTGALGLTQTRDLIQ